MENITYKGLKKIRKKKKLSQEDLALKVGITQKIVSFMENGKYNPTGKMLNRIAKVLECEPKDLY